MENCTITGSQCLQRSLRVQEISKTRGEEEEEEEEDEDAFMT